LDDWLQAERELEAEVLLAEASVFFAPSMKEKKE
jgi:hypothetical protein